MVPIQTQLVIFSRDLQEVILTRPNVRFPAAKPRVGFVTKFHEPVIFSDVEAHQHALEVTGLNIPPANWVLSSFENTEYLVRTMVAVVAIPLWPTAKLVCSANCIVDKLTVNTALTAQWDQYENSRLDFCVALSCARFMTFTSSTNYDKWQPINLDVATPYDPKDL